MADSAPPAFVDPPALMHSLPETLRDRLDILACPFCRSRLTMRADSLACEACDNQYAVKNAKIYFTTPPKHQTSASGIKHFLRLRLGSSYNRAVRLFGPGLPVNKRSLLLRNIDPDQDVAVDLGSGTERIHPKVITLDLFDYPEVDIVCDLQSLPFAEKSVDAFITTSVLEHIEDPAGLIEQTFICTREGGLGIHSFPFLFPYHESPRDFIRYTHSGSAVLFRKWKIQRTFNVSGPISSFNTLTAEFLSSLLSVGDGRVKEALHLIVGAILSPLKYIDLLFIDKKQFLSSSAMLCTIVERPVDQ